jgi:hypothetical protein
MALMDRSRLILKYKDGYDEILRSLEGFPEQELATRPIANKWSAREIIHHLADSETVSGIRLKRLLVEDHPLIQGYDQEAFAERLNYNNRDIGPALDAFRSARANTAQLLDAMTEEDWKREGTHSESGSYTAEDWLTIYAEHAHNHAAQILRLRERLG